MKYPVLGVVLRLQYVVTSFEEPDVPEPHAMEGDLGGDASKAAARNQDFMSGLNSLIFNEGINEIECAFLLIGESNTNAEWANRKSLPFKFFNIGRSQYGIDELCVRQWSIPKYCSSRGLKNLFPLIQAAGHSGRNPFTIDLLYKSNLLHAHPQPNVHLLCGLSCQFLIA